MKMKFTNILSVLFIITMAFSCYFDNEETLYPQPNSCDTLNVRYSTHVEPVLKNYCYACHGTSNYRSSGGDLLLEGFSNIKVVVDNGVLLKSINHVNGVSPMPKNSAKLSPCNIDKITGWISEGSKQ
jgi:hypothetical protein